MYLSIGNLIKSVSKYRISKYRRNDFKALNPNYLNTSEDRGKENFSKM